MMGIFAVHISTPTPHHARFTCMYIHEVHCNILLYCKHGIDNNLYNMKHSNKFCKVPTMMCCTEGYSVSGLCPSFIILKELVFKLDLFHPLMDRQEKLDLVQ
jgi:hypothetical protein